MFHRTAVRTVFMIFLFTVGHLAQAASHRSSTCRSWERTFCWRPSAAQTSFALGHPRKRCCKVSVAEQCGHKASSSRAWQLQRTSEKLNRVNEWQAVRSSKLREVMNARHQRGESRHEAYLAQVAKRAGDESNKVNEVRFITSPNKQNKKFLLRQKLHDSEMRRAEKLQVIKTKQKEDNAREEAVLERKRFLEAEKMQRLAEIQRKKEEAIIRREEERKASSAAREARAAEQQRRKEIRAKAQEEEAELLAQKLLKSSVKVSSAANIT